MSQPIPAEPNREVADDDVDTDLAKREPNADPGADAAETEQATGATAGE
jgi:hypothetical protein